MRQCRSVHVKYRGKLISYVYCTLPPHPQDDDHFDAAKNYYWTAPTLLEGEFEIGRKTKAGAVAAKKKVRLCKKCGKEIRTDGANEACVCAETGANKQQSILFAADRERIARQASQDDLQTDIDWIRAKHAEMWEQFIDEECEGYRGDF